MKLLEAMFPRKPRTRFLTTRMGSRCGAKSGTGLEYKPKKGYRFVSQTTNPKRPGKVWNKPKASTYSKLGGAMYLNENGTSNLPG